MNDDSINFNMFDEMYTMDPLTHNLEVKSFIGGMTIPPDAPRYRCKQCEMKSLNCYNTYPKCKGYKTFFIIEDKE